MQNRLLAVAFILIAGAGVAGCGQAQTNFKITAEC